MRLVSPLCGQPRDLQSPWHWTWRFSCTRQMAHPLLSPVPLTSSRMSPGNWLVPLL